jgi:hypothetical protein
MVLTYAMSKKIPLKGNIENTLINSKEVCIETDKGKRIMCVFVIRVQEEIIISLSHLMVYDCVFVFSD